MIMVRKKSQDTDNCITITMYYSISINITIISYY